MTLEDLDVFQVVGCNQWIARVLDNPRYSIQRKYDTLFDSDYKEALMGLTSAWDTESPLEEYLRNLAEEFEKYMNAMIYTLQPEDVKAKVQSIIDEYKKNSEGAHFDEDLLFSTLVLATSNGHDWAGLLCSEAVLLIKTYRQKWYA